MEKGDSPLPGSCQNHTRFLKNNPVRRLGGIGQALGRRGQGWGLFGYIPKPTFPLSHQLLAEFLSPEFVALEPSDLHRSWGGKTKGSGQSLWSHGGLSGKSPEASSPALFSRVKSHAPGPSLPHLLCKPHLSSFLAR